MTFAQVTTNDVRRTNEALLLALLPHAYAESALYLRQTADSMDSQSCASDTERAARKRVAGALRLAAETLTSSDAAWNAARDSEYGRLERATFDLD